MHITRLSDADEVRLGDELARRCGLSTAPQAPEMSSVQDYINRVGARVAAHAWRKLLFQFYLDLNPNLINAFALPGGHVVIGLGLVNQMKSEDELAFVLAHESEHIDHYNHGSNSVSKIQLFDGSNGSGSPYALHVSITVLVNPGAPEQGYFSP